jgi:hypothetical protein
MAPKSDEEKRKESGFSGTEMHGWDPAWVAYRQLVNAEQKAETESAEIAARGREATREMLINSIKVTVRATLPPEARALIYEVLVRDDCAGSPQAQHAVDKRLAAFGFTP